MNQIINFNISQTLNPTQFVHLLFNIWDLELREYGMKTCGRHTCIGLTTKLSSFASGVLLSGKCSKL
jgi:hypothetical protein